MRLHALSFILLASLALAYGIPTPEITDAQSVIDQSKIESADHLAVEAASDDKERAKKSATTFCVEVRPSENHVKECTCNQCAEKAERVIVEPPAPQPCQQIVQPPKPKPTQPPPPPPTHRPKPKPMPLPVPQETIRPMPPACAEPQVYVMPSSPMIIMPEHHEAPKPVTHHHTCHKCGHQHPVAGCQCSSCRAAQLRSNEMASYEHFMSPAHMMRHDARQQQLIYPSPGMTMYGGDIPATSRQGDAGRNGGMGTEIVREPANPNIVIHTDMPTQPPRTYRQESQTPYYVTLTEYPQYPYPNPATKPRVSDEDSGEEEEESSHTETESVHESTETVVESEVDVESNESLASEAEDMSRSVVKRETRSYQPTESLTLDTQNDSASTELNINQKDPSASMMQGGST